MVLQLLQHSTCTIIKHTFVFTVFWLQEPPRPLSGLLWRPSGVLGVLGEVFWGVSERLNDLGRSAGVPRGPRSIPGNHMWYPSVLLGAFWAFLGGPLGAHSSIQGVLGSFQGRPSAFSATLWFEQVHQTLRLCRFERFLQVKLKEGFVFFGRSPSV